MSFARRVLPALVLFLLSPLMAEILFGATPVSRLGALALVAPIYGCGVLLIRELARRRTRPWVRIALFAGAYAILEEGLALRSMFDPKMFNAGMLGGRAFGVNWIWVIWTVGYHQIWSTMIPIALTELFFSSRREQPWLKAPGMVLCAVLYFCAISAMASFVPKQFSPDYHTPLPLFVAAILVAAVLVCMALFLPLEPRQRTLTPAAPPNPWALGVASLIVTVLWFALLKLPHALKEGAVVILPAAFILTVAVVFALRIRRWTQDAQWTGAHIIMLSLGAMLTSMSWGYFYVTVNNPLDHLAQAIMMALTVVVLLALAFRYRATHLAPARLSA
jgi:hypothetical protein